MAYRLTWAPIARQDLHELVAYIAKNNPRTARKVARRIFRTTERLARFPQSGRVVPEFDDPAIREVIRKPVRVVYRVRTAEEKVEIVRVWHAARGMPAL